MDLVWLRSAPAPWVAYAIGWGRESSERCGETCSDIRGHQARHEVGANFVVKLAVFGSQNWRGAGYVKLAPQMKIGSFLRWAFNFFSLVDQI